MTRQRSTQSPPVRERDADAAPWREPRSRDDARAAPAPAAPGAPAVFVGEVAGTAADGAPLVFAGGNRPLPALAVVSTPPIDWSRCKGLRVALGFVGGDPDRPVVLGLLDAPPAVPAAVPPAVRRIESGQELVIECGKARIALRADGRIEIRGGHLISRSSGPNKIKGATVDIN